MQRKLQRKAQRFTVDDFFSEDADLPRKMELIDGIIGPYSDKAKLALLANWGADRIVKLTGPEIWLEAIEALEKRRARTRSAR